MIFIVRALISILLDDYDTYLIVIFALKWSILLIASIFALELIYSLVVYFRNQQKNAFKIIRNKYLIYFLIVLIVATCMVSRQVLEGIIISYIVYFTEKIRAVFYRFKKEK
jgi:hypothetical protein